jgi:D-aminopeptidase
MVVLGTDAPLSERQLRRLAVRGGLGVARAGSMAASGSGEYVLAFSTAHRVSHRSEAARDRFEFLRDDSAAMRVLFEAAAELVHEAVLNALCVADAVEGRDGHVAPALDHGLLAGAPGVRTL